MEACEVPQDLTVDQASAAVGVLAERAARNAIEEAARAARDVEWERKLRRALDAAPPCPRCKTKGYIRSSVDGRIIKCRECQQYGRDLQAFLRSFGVEPLPRPEAGGSYGG